MARTTNDIAPTSTVAALTNLRTLASEPSASLAAALDAADSQAAYMHGLLAHQEERSPVTLIPTITLEYIDDLPAPGSSFWAKGRWHIHIRATDSVDMQTFTVLHQLKHIIDYPLRHHATHLRASEWETLADHFANKVLSKEGSSTFPNERKGVLLP